MTRTYDKNSLIVGRKQCVKAIADHVDRIECVWIAKDADASMIDELIALSASKELPIENVETKAQLGKRCGIDVGAAVACVLRHDQRE